MTPDMYKRCLVLGAASVVVGGAITRQLKKTRRFIEAQHDVIGTNKPGI
ncbi:hypothetical protein [Paenibacillus sp. YAF4_2]